MAVDSAWLKGVREKNRRSVGLAGLGGMGYVSSQGLVDAARDERDLRTQSIHAGRLSLTDPNKPSEGSIESIAATLGPVNVPAPPQIPPGVAWGLGLVGIAAAGYVAYKLAKG